MLFHSLVVLLCLVHLICLFFFSKTFADFLYHFLRSRFLLLLYSNLTTLKFELSKINNNKGRCYKDFLDVKKSDSTVCDKLNDLTNKCTFIMTSTLCKNSESFNVSLTVKSNFLMSKKSL